MAQNALGRRSEAAGMFKKFSRNNRCFILTCVKIPVLVSQLPERRRVEFRSNKEGKVESHGIRHWVHTTPVMDCRQRGLNMMALKAD